MIILLITITIFLILLPGILRLLGFHPHKKRERFKVEGKRVLIVTTSHKRGLFSSEMTIPYYEFIDNKMHVDISSIKGGKIPIEKMSLIWPIASWGDRRFKRDSELLKKVENAKAVEDIDFSTYDVIFFPGGWGAAYDLGYSEYIGREVSMAYSNGAIVASVCHGALGLINAKKESGEPLIKGKRVTGVTNKQIKELRVEDTPQHPETELRKLDVDYVSKSAFLDIFATCVVKDDRVVTGQNQNSGQEVAYEIMRILEKREAAR